MLILSKVSYIHPDRSLLFKDISLSLAPHGKAALTGSNGTGKSTLLRLITGAVRPYSGTIATSVQPYFIPQVCGQFDDLSIAGALGVIEKYSALQAILNGQTDARWFDMLADDWTIEERCMDALAGWNICPKDLNAKMGGLSGGQQTRVFLAGLSLHQPELVLMDEPSNHLDSAGRELLYAFIRNTPAALLIVSHDRSLLQLMETIMELDRKGLQTYGGNYTFYTGQKQAELESWHQDVKEAEKALRKARDTARMEAARQQKLDARGRKKKEREGVARIMLNTLRNNAETSTARAREAHAEKTGLLAESLRTLRQEAPDPEEIRFSFGSSSTPAGKLLFRAAKLRLAHGSELLRNSGLNTEICSGARILLEGANGSGKTSLLQVINGMAAPLSGELYRAAGLRTVYLDQDYRLVDPHKDVYALACMHNHIKLPDHELRNRLNRFLFPHQAWTKPCSALSGGERMRLTLCCLSLHHHAPDLLLLDEPTNNLDLQNIRILTAAVRRYEGALVVVTHDPCFRKEIMPGHQIRL